MSSLFLLTTVATAQTCSGTVELTANSGTLEDGSGDEDYSTFRNCRWNITPQNGGPIRLVITEFDVFREEFFSRGEGLYVNTGNGEFLTDLSGDLSTAVPIVINVPGNTARLVFLTDETTSEGWSLRYESGFTNEAPVIEPQTFATPEQTIPGTIIGEVEAADETPNILLHYNILSGNEAGFFELNERTGELSVVGDETKLLDFETQDTYTLRVEVSDGIDTDVTNVTVNVTDVEEISLPQVIKPLQAIELGIRLPGGTELATVEVSNPGAAPLFFQVVALTPRAPDVLIDEFGIITSRFGGFPNPGVYEYLVAVSNEIGASFAKITFSVVEFGCEGVTLLTENSGEFSDGSGPSYYGPSDCGWHIRPTGGGPIRITAEEMRVSFEDPPVSIYRGADTNAPLINAFPKFSSETIIATDAEEVFVSFVTRTDPNSFFDDQGLTLQYESGFTNQAPVATSYQAIGVPSDLTMGDSFGFIVAADPDGDRLNFRIKSGNFGEDLQIRSSTGSLSFARDIPDRSGISTYPLIIGVSDGIDEIDVSVPVSVLNDAPPPIIQDQTFVLDDGVASFGEIVVSDESNLLLSYTIIDTDFNGFLLVRNNGRFETGSSSLIDFETQPTFTIDVEVDNGFATATATITVQVEDVGCTGAVRLTENEATVSDGNGDRGFDEDGNFRVGNYENNSSCEWTLAPTNGGPIEIAFAEFEVEELFDSLIFSTEVNGSLQMMGVFFGDQLPDTLVIDSDELLVNFNTGAAGTAAGWTFNYRSLNTAPTASDQEFGILESSTSATAVGTISATDEQNDVISYAIISGNTDDAFTIDTESGELTVNNPDALDPSSNISFSLTIEVSDGFITSTSTVVISIIEVLSIASEPTGFEVYPNPASDHLTIKLNREDVVEIIVTDLNGKDLIAASGESLKRGTEIDLPINLPDGIYMLRVAGDGFTESIKIVVSRNSKK